jgi:hypothetical protein
MKMLDLIWLPEPRVLVAHNQQIEDPRDGLTLFGPLDRGAPYGVKYGVIGTKDGIQRVKQFVKRIERPVADEKESAFRPPFLGFEAVYGIPWTPVPAIEIVISDEALQKSVHIDEPHQRVFKTVELYSNEIIRAQEQEDARVDLWLVVVPEDVYKYCRPRSKVEKSLRVESDAVLSAKSAKMYRDIPSLFENDNEAAKLYEYEVNFHNQLKARLLESHVPTQIVREGTLDLDRLPTFKDSPSAIAWSLCNGIYYKVGGRPWKIGNIRDGVCYIGIVFKQDHRQGDPRSSCCAAQMFLDSGDGIVFKGNVGPWYSPKTGDYHLATNAAKQLISIAVQSYVRTHGRPPTELFIHGKTRFNDEEWRGFQQAVDAGQTNLVGVQIRKNFDLKLYGHDDYPVLRGLAGISNDYNAYVWTNGYSPRIQTYNGKEVPNPLKIEVCRGKADIQLVIADILALTKLNYNTCILADGLPVTLRFADAIGEILTAGPIGNHPPLPFRHYI